MKTEEIIMHNNNILKSFLNTALKEIIYILRIECGSLFIFDYKNKELVLDSLHNSGDLHIQGLKRKVGEGIAGKVVDTKIPVLVKDIDKDSRFRRNGFTHYHTNSFISIPLISSRGAVMGVMNIADKSNGEPFTEKDFNFAVMICRYACLAVDLMLDYADLKQKEEDFNKQKSSLEKYASVGKLAAGIVHEVNNPLDGTIRYANMLLHQLEDNSVAREYLLEVKKGLGRIANITKSLFDFSRKIDFSSSQAKKYVDLHEVIEESLDVFNGRLNGSIRVEKEYSRNLPKILDFGISHIVINLIKNALDAMPDKGTLRIYADKKEAGLEIRFEDTGSGIPEDIRGRIFDPFFTTKSVGDRAGLGLAICREIIARYKGRIDAQSTPDIGSAFTVYIPEKYLKNA